MNNAVSDKKKVTIPIAIGYGLTDIMGGGAFTIIGAWVMQLVERKYYLSLSL